MIFKLFSLVMLVLLLSSCSERKSKWIEIGSNTDVHIYMDKHVEMGADKNLPYVMVEMLWDYHQPKNHEEKIYNSSVKLVLIDCKQNLASPFKHTEYSGPMATGSVVYSDERDIKAAKADFQEIQNLATKAVAELSCRPA